VELEFLMVRGGMITMCRIARLFLVLLVLGCPKAILAQARLDGPTANLEIDNAVPMSVVNSIALAKAAETWGPGALGTPVPLADLNGGVVVYMVPFQIGGNAFPPYEDILAGIKEGRELRALISNGELEKAGEKQSGLERPKSVSPRAVVVTDTETPRRPPLDSVRPDGSASRRAALESTRDLERFAARKTIGADEFGTIFVSASYGRFPVLAYFHYLAPYYFNFDSALAQAERAIGPGVVLKHMYFLGLEGQFFEFESASGSLLLNSKTLETTSLKQLQSNAPPTLAPAAAVTSPETKAKTSADIAAAWEKVLSEVGAH